MLVGSLLALAPLAHASPTSGAIDPAHKYAWGTVAGWVNFAPTNGGLTITDSLVTGYAWGANTGWIHFNATNGGVTNTTTGTLGGYAWDSGGGWVSFAGVTIDSSGRFHGTATGGTVAGASYMLNFDCTSCDVRTDWRPASSSTTTTISSSGGNGAIAPILITTTTTTASISPAASPTSPPTTTRSVSGNKAPYTENPASTTIATFKNTVFKNTAASSTTRTATAATTTKKPVVFSFFNFMIFVGAVAIFTGILAFFRSFTRF